MKEFIDKTSTVDGTKINRANLMAMQGMQQSNLTISGYTFTEVHGSGDNSETLTVTINPNGTITRVFVGAKVGDTRLTITKTTTLSPTGIVEVIS